MTNSRLGPEQIHLCPFFQNQPGFFEVKKAGETTTAVRSRRGRLEPAERGTRGSQVSVRRKWREKNSARFGPIIE